MLDTQFAYFLTITIPYWLNFRKMIMWPDCKEMKSGTEAQCGASLNKSGATIFMRSLSTAVIYQITVVVFTL